LVAGLLGVGVLFLLLFFVLKNTTLIAAALAHHPSVLRSLP